jgi:hypothetical protein
MNKAMKLKTCEDIEIATSKFVGAFQHDEKQLLPNKFPSAQLASYPLTSNA